MLSRLLYGVHIWGTLSAWALRSLNAVYMSLLRKVAGQNWKGEAGRKLHTDLDVRLALAMPPLEHHIAQTRLVYLVQVLRSDATYLRALLATPQATEHGWTKIVLQNLTDLASFHRFKLKELGDPCLQSSAWSEFICKWPEQWKSLVKSWPLPII